MAIGKVGQQRCNLPGPEYHRHVDPEQAARLDPLGSDGGIGSLDVGEDAFGGFEVAAPGFGDRQPPRCPMEELDPKPRFQRRHMLGDHGLRQAHGPRSPGQAADRRHFGENFQAGQPVEHGISLHQCELFF